MFKIRSTQQEIMDDLLCEGPVVERTLKELDKINLLLGGNDVSLSAINQCLKKIRKDKPIHIADLGCGSGDLLRIICKRARKKNLPVLLTGIDANPFIAEYAKKHCREFSEIQIECLDVFSDKLISKEFDLVNCTLFCHHFDNYSLIALLHKLGKRTSTAIIINDIHRHWFAFYSIKWLTRIFSSSSMVKNDAKLSVLKAFRKQELEKIIRQAGYTNFSIRWKWAFRYEVIIWTK